MAGDALTASGVQQQRAAVPPSPPARAHPPKGANGASDSGAAPGSRPTQRRDSPWTVEMDERLRDIWMQGLSATQMGAVLGQTKNSILGRAHRLRLPSRPSPIGKGNCGLGAAPKQPRAAPLKPGATTLPAIATPAPEPEPAFKPIRPGACRFPLWGNGRPTHRYCGKPTKAGSPYCPKCHALCYTKAPAR